MNIGDLVKWLGYPGASHQENVITGPVTVGIIIDILSKGRLESNVEGMFRYDVAWGDGTIGRMLYPETLEVIDESR